LLDFIVAKGRGHGAHHLPFGIPRVVASDIRPEMLELPLKVGLRQTGEIGGLDCLASCAIDHVATHAALLEKVLTRLAPPTGVTEVSKYQTQCRYRLVHVQPRLLFCPYRDMNVPYERKDCAITTADTRLAIQRR
jgi:hypothetical protein